MSVVSASTRLIEDNHTHSRTGLRPARFIWKGVMQSGFLATLISLLIMTGSFLPATAQAGIFGMFLTSFTRNTSTMPAGASVQTMSLPKPAQNPNPTAAKGGGDITIVDGSAVMPDEGPSGTIADIERPKNSSISRYVVREGDTLSGIASLFDVSVNTIMWANNLPKSGTIRPGQTLTILPVTGVKYTVKKGDTLASIAKTMHGDAEEIAQFNGLSSGASLAVGTELIIPDGEIAVPVVAKAPARSSGSSSVSASPVSAGAYIRPVAGVRTQGIHGYNGVDIGAPTGTPVVASAAGTVIISRQGGWNGGYGNYIVIEHANGTQTLYAHNSENAVGIGEYVVQGQVIGYVGATGKATGPHLHFEIRNGPRNPF